jgi:CBS domain-containing protein
LDDPTGVKPCRAEHAAGGLHPLAAATMKTDTQHNAPLGWLFLQRKPCRIAERAGSAKHAPVFAKLRNGRPSPPICWKRGVVLLLFACFGLGTNSARTATVTAWKGVRAMKTVSDIMTTEVTTLERNDSLQVAKDIMNLGRVRHFPVIEDEKVVGVVSQRDLYKASLGSVMKYGEKAQRAFLEGIAIKEVMNVPVVTIAPHASVQDAARLMIEKKIGCLPVLEGPKLVGIVTETDMLKLVAEMH